MLCNKNLVLVLGVLKNSPKPGYLAWIKLSNHVMVSNPKHVSNLPYYVAIINVIFPNWLFKKETMIPYKMKIKD